MLILRNLESVAVRARVVLPEVTPRQMTEEFSGKTMAAISVDGETVMDAAMDANEVQVYRG